MFYYQFNIGDYLKHTAHLTPLEDIAYRRLLDFYYDTEVPIPTAIPLVSRRLRIPAETVKVVLDEFFQLTDEGYRNKRADAEIVAYHAFLQKQKANGIKGGRPKTKPIDNPPVSQHEPKITLNTNREPLTTKQHNTKTIQRFALIIPADVSEIVWKDFLSTRKTKLTQTALIGIAKQADIAGISLEAALQECCTRGWQSFKAAWVQQGQPQKTQHQLNQEAIARSIFPDKFKTDGGTVYDSPVTRLLD